MLEKKIAESCSEATAAHPEEETSSKEIALTDDQLEAVAGGIHCRKAGGKDLLDGSPTDVSRIIAI